jgi:hypothetical protein
VIAAMRWGCTSEAGALLRGPKEGDRGRRFNENGRPASGREKTIPRQECFPFYANDADSLGERDFLPTYAFDHEAAVRTNPQRDNYSIVVFFTCLH